jgi:hypothetical protein
MILRRTLLATACLATVPFAAHAAPTQVAACQMITAPGSYELAANLSSTGDCMIIASDWVTLDLKGFLITGAGRGSGVVELRGQPFRGTTVRNGVITNFGSGIELPNGTGTTVERINASANNGNGIVTGYRPVVRDSTAADNAGSGIRVGAGGLVIGNSVGRNKASGISTVDGASVLNNVSRNNSGNGVFMDCPGLFMGNTSSNNGGVNFLDVSGGCVVDEHNSTL